ncbi:MAG: hypothetical protein IKE10_00990 [Bacilli bacterium]|nr:hypothetical protein [Bacilli bacterium]
MRRELNNFIIESDIKIDYFDDIVNHVLENEKRIFEFFELDNLPDKITIRIMSYDGFMEYAKEKNHKILGYERGFSDYSMTIKLLNIDDQKKYTTHKNANLDEFKGTLLHEIIHKCQLLVKKFPRECIWFSEGLATNLSNQFQYSICSLNECDFNELVNNFNPSIMKLKYPYAYTIVNYILNNYSKEEINRFIKDPNYLMEKANILFEEAKEWTKNIIKK